MHPHQLIKRNRTGFSVIEALLVILVVAALAVTGFVVYQHHKPSSAKNSAATNSPQTTSQQTNTSSTQPQPTTYLTIKEWGVKLPLSSAISNAYYIVAEGSDSSSGGLPDRMWLGLTSYNSSSCNPANNDAGGRGAIGAVLRVSPTDTDPVSGKLLTQEYPNGATIGGYYYTYQSWAKNNPCASDSTLQPIDSAFATSAKNMVLAPQYLDIKEWGVRLTLTSDTASLYYYIKPDLADVAYFSLKAISDVAPDCAADKISLGAISRLTPAEHQSAINDPTRGIPGSIHIGNYWYGYSSPQATCIESAAMQAAVSKAAPNFDRGTLLNTFNTLAADTATN